MNSLPVAPTVGQIVWWEKTEANRGAISPDGPSFRRLPPKTFP
jgi:hypothetical protein